MSAREDRMRNRITSHRASWVADDEHAWLISGLDFVNDRDDWFFLMELINQRGVRHEAMWSTYKDELFIRFDTDSGTWADQCYCAELVDKFCDGSFAEFRRGLRNVRTIDDWYRLRVLAEAKR